MGHLGKFTTGEGVPLALTPRGDLIEVRAGMFTFHLTRDEAERFGVKLIRCIDAIKPKRRARAA